MSRLAIMLILLAVVCVIPSSALARKIGYNPAPPGMVARATGADLVVVGHVTAIEQDETEVVESADPNDKAMYKVAVLRIDDALTDAGGQTHVRIGYDPINATPRYRGGYGRYSFRMTGDAVGVFFLTKHPSGSFYVFSHGYPPLEASEKTYRDDLDLVRKTVAAINEPLKALRAADAKDRYFAAAALAQKYKTAPMTGGSRNVEISPEESRLILQAVLDVDWTDTVKDAARPYETFVKLGLTAKDKWQPAAFDGNGDQEGHTKAELQKWFDGNGKAYKLEKIVPAK